MERRRYLVGCGTILGVITGCTTNEPDDGDDTSNAVYREAFRDALTDDDIEIQTLTNTDGRVELVYSPGSIQPDATAPEIEARVEETVYIAAEAFFDRVYGGWAVDFLDATVKIQDTVVATWHMDSEWIDGYLAGEYSRNDLIEMVEASVERHYEPESESDPDSEGDMNGTTAGAVIGT